MSVFSLQFEINMPDKVFGTTWFAELLRNRYDDINVEIKSLLLTKKMH